MGAGYLYLLGASPIANPSGTPPILSFRHW